MASALKNKFLPHFGGAFFFKYDIINIMDDNNQQGWLNQKPASFPPAQPADRPKPPPPPPPEITLRTMKSDLESLKQTGGSMPIPKPFTPPELKREALPAAASTPPAPPLPPRPQISKITPSEFGEPKKMESSAASSAPIIEEEGKSESLKKILVWFLGAVLAIGVGLAGYYFIYPSLFPAQVPPPAITNQTPPAQNPVLAVPEVQLPPAVAPHQSLLKSADQNSAAKLSAADLNSIKTVLQEEAKKLNPPGTLAELAMSDAKGQASASAVFSALIPEISSDTMKLFQEDFTAALYYDANGVWPAYILKLKSEASQVEAQTAIGALESSKNLKNFFLADPGTPSASGFKSGKASEVLTRYLTYSKKGAGLNVAWSGDKLVVSASFDGLKKILANLAQ